MNENRLPPGYVPLTIHEINGQSVKQNSSRRSEGGGDRGRRNTKSKGGRLHSRRRYPRQEEEIEPIEE